MCSTLCFLLLKLCKKCLLPGSIMTVLLVVFFCLFVFEAFNVVLAVKTPKMYICLYGDSQKYCFLILLISMASKLHLVY